MREQIDASAAMTACSAAVAANPKVARYHFQLGRALNKAGKLNEAMAEYGLATEFRRLDCRNIHRRYV
jgi:predicted TPR repeat methyltransferase